MMDTKIILVCANNKEKHRYLYALESLDVAVNAVTSFKTLESLLLENPYHGVMADLKTKIKAMKNEKNEKELAYQILDQYTVVQLRLDEETSQIKILSAGKSSHDASLEKFIEADCCSFESRTSRSNPRISYHFNVMISKTEDFSEEMSFRIKDLKDDTPIQGEVRWFKPWSRSMGIPSIGLLFTRIG